MTRERRKRPPGAGGPVAPKGAPGGPRRPAAPAAEVPGRGGNRPGPSLVMTTLLGSFPVTVDHDTGEIMEGPVAVTLVEYPDGVELSAAPRTAGRRGSREDQERKKYERELRDFGPAEANRRAAERREEKATRSKDESIRRAKSSVRKIVRYFALRFMVTLTFPGEGVHDYDRALRLLQDFMHDHGERIHLGGRYLAVPELHPGGHGWHWHVLVSRRFAKPELSALWEGWTAFLGRRGMQPSGGARYARIDVKDWGRASSAASYAAKYVGKSLEDGCLGKNRRRFLVSLGAKVQSISASAESLDEVEEVAQSVPGAYVRHIEGEDGRPPIVWACWD